MTASPDWESLLWEARGCLGLDDVDGGQLVVDVETEHRGHLGREVKIGCELVGFANVTDWDGIRSALAKRGHGVGAMHHLPEFTDHEVTA